MSAVILAAMAVGLLHTLLGPDHYVPFVALARAGKWSRARLAWVTLLCGLGHVLSSVALGAAAIALGWAAQELELVESFRAKLAAWGLIGFGTAYFSWGLHRAWCPKPHTQRCLHADGTMHSHPHSHTAEHVHRSGAATTNAAGRVAPTPWLLFAIFVFGPCEPLIPLMMIPALNGGAFAVALTVSAFAAATLLTMLGCVLLFEAGLTRLPLAPLDRYAHALAGAAVAACGLAIVFLGL